MHPVSVYFTVNSIPMWEVLRPPTPMAPGLCPGAMGKENRTSNQFLSLVARPSACHGDTTTHSALGRTPSLRSALLWFADIAH